MREELLLESVNPKTGATSGKQFWNYKTDMGYMNCFDTIVAGLLGAHIGKFVAVETQTSGNYKNIIKFYEVLKDKVPKKSSILASQLTSYTKDVVCCLIDKNKDLDVMAIFELATNEIIKTYKKMEEME